MATKVVCTIREDKQELQKQFGCMNGIFQLFDRRYLLGLHRHGHTQKKLSSGQGENGEKEFKNASEKSKEKKPKKVTIEKNRSSIESSRNSFSSSCSSTTFSSLDCSKRVQTEWQLPSEPTSPHLHKKQQNWSPDIRNLVKDSMTREICVASVRNVEKNERADLIKHVDSPRPFIRQKSVQNNRKDRNLAKVPETSSGVEKVKETSRFSCDEKESQYSLKSTLKVNELARLSLDSKQNSKGDSMNKSKTLNQSHEPGSNKRPSSGVVARLMGLESLTDSIHEVETSKIKPSLDDEWVSSSRWSNKVEVFKENYVSVSVSVSPRVYLEPTTPERRFHTVTSGGPLGPVLQKKEGGDRGSRKSPVENNEAPVRAKNGALSVYGEMEKRLSGLEFKTSTKNLRALKQILDAMQTNKEHALEIRKRGQPVLPTFKKAVKPVTVTTDSKMITGLDNVNRSDSRKDLFTRKQGKDRTLRNQKVTGRAPRPLSPSNSPEYPTAERPVLRPKLPRSKNGIQKQCFHGPSPDSSRIKKQANVQPVISDLKTRSQRLKPVNPMQSNKQSCSIGTRSLSQDGDTVSFRSKNNTSLASKSKPEVTRNDQPKENHRVNEVENNFAERLIEDMATTELAKLTVERPSPVSVLDAFYTENTPSPVKKKPNAFNDYENLHVDETERNEVGNLNSVNDTDMDRYSEFNHVKLENRDDEATINETTESPCEITNGDHSYIREILLASGILKDLDSATRMVQLHPTVGLIKPDLFHLLEETKGYAELKDDGCHKRNPRSKSNEKIRRLTIFDSVNDILFHKLAMSGSYTLWTGERRGRLLNGEKLLKELCSEIDRLQTSSNRCLYDEDDEVKDIVSEEVNKNLEYWDKCCYEVPGLVLDIERLIFKDLIDEVVNAELGKR